jgi:hypothetical protein
MKMSRTKFIKELLEQIKKDPSMQGVVTFLTTNLEKSEAFTRKWKKYSQYAVLMASIMYNVLQALGIW